MFSANENIQLRQYKRRIVDYIEETIPDDVLDMGVNVMAMQVNCKAPGCVPIETAIVMIFPASKTELLPGLPESAGGSYKTKVLKPMSAVSREDVLEALPPSFIGGKRSMERLCLQARDVMLGQVTQLFGDTDVAGRRLMAEYLQSSLQEYMDRDCEPPVWGEEFPVTDASSKLERVPVSTTSGESELPMLPRTGNIVMQRPVDQDAGTKASAASVVMAGSLVPSLPSPSPTKTKFTGTTTTAVSVNSVTKRRQQQAAERRLQSFLSGNSSTLLSQLAEREHAPGVRRPGCPCCDPDNPSNVFDQLMMQL